MMGRNAAAGCRRRLVRLAALLGFVAIGGCQVPPMSPAPRTDPSLARDGDARVQIELAQRLLIGAGLPRDTASGVALIERRAEAGDPGAQTTIGNFYFSGFGVERNPETAAAWLQKAAAQHDPKGTVDLALLYMRGAGVPQDYGRAADLVKPLADQGYPAALDALGLLHLNGQGAAKDERLAVALFRRAADKKLGLAMFHLAEAYRDGHGVAADRVVAYAWFDLAASNARGAPDRSTAVKSRDELSLVLLPDDLALGRRLADLWKPGVDLAAARMAGLPAASTARSSDAGTARIAAPPPGQTAAARDFPVRQKLLTYAVKVRADGSSTAKMHMELAAKSQSAVKDVSQLPLVYRSGLDEIEVNEAYTLKSDGRRLPVAGSAILTQPVPGSPNVPMFDDRRQKVILFPDVQAGDVVALTATYVSKPVVPGYFTMSQTMDLNAPTDEVRISIEVPKGIPLAVETHEMDFSKRSSGDKTVYEWRYANPNPPADVEMVLDRYDREPRLFASTFSSYEQLAAAYSALAEPKGAVTAEIRKLADTITAGVADRRKQAELIYDWVSKRIRYVAIELGDGAIVPHAAATVLANGYGDCKDHATLFAALLKAKGIAANTALINYGASYTRPGPPGFGSLNHAITWLPEFKVFADTTAGVAPFGILPFGQYGKPVILVGVTPVLRRTPILQPGAASITLKTTAHLSADGRITGDSSSISTGPFSVGMRQVAVQIESAGAEKAAKYQLRQAGYEGSGKFTFDSPFEMAPQYRISGHFETNPRLEMLAGNSFHLPLGLALGWRPGDELLGPLEFHDVVGHEPTPCYSGQEIEEVSLELPEGKTLRALPQATEIKNDILSYTAQWSVAGRTVTLRREFTAKVAEAVCIGEVRAKAARALNEIRGAYNREVVSLIDR
jgi:TPR repeat protein/transglutaminase-like putative cysteine protease